MTNVTKLHPTDALTPEQTSHRILAAVRAVHMFHEELIRTDVRLRDAETKELSDATKYYREMIRDATDRGDSLTPEESHEMLPQICHGLETRDEIAAANKKAREERTAERKRVQKALAELQSPAKDDAQLSLSVDSTGLSWFGSDTVAVTYTALLDADTRGMLDEVQGELLVELGSAGLEAIEFVIDAAGAIEDEPQPEPVDENTVADLDEITGDDLPV